MTGYSERRITDNMLCAGFTKEGGKDRWDYWIRFVGELREFHICFDSTLFSAVKETQAVSLNFVTFGAQRCEINFCFTGPLHVVDDESKVHQIVGKFKLEFSEKTFPFTLNFFQTFRRGVVGRRMRKYQILFRIFRIFFRHYWEFWISLQFIDGSALRGRNIINFGKWLFWWFVSAYTFLRWQLGQCEEWLSVSMLQLHSKKKNASQFIDFFFVSITKCCLCSWQFSHCLPISFFDNLRRQQLSWSPTFTL